MTTRQLLRDALRTILGPAVRAHGYRGTAPTWRKESELGDVAVINMQMSAYGSAWDSSCVVNLSVEVVPWAEMTAARMGIGTRQLLHSPGGLWHRRLTPSEASDDGPEQWWSVTDEASARFVVEDVVAQLEDRWFGVLDDLLAPGGMLRQVRSGDLGYGHVADWQEHFAEEIEMLERERPEPDTPRAPQ
ncbi:DUF4304 domain-containing protein [Curtobacterium sp. Leaf261]|uniref:DUF4304 domain-containing protein n=1 Tax=Curtobacterium sp. Leaf261 TaxID=1736311 RepID=UPI0007152EBF|nr:DUF4304 domain-containing protein [Curtobacterium sp. Leaf261]KQO64537.1 hypothetical protein ASF23_16255 [Curtobacterium sp. Leaf261]